MAPGGMDVGAIVSAVVGKYVGASTPGTLSDLVGEPEGILLFALLADLDFLDFFDLVDFIDFEDSAVVLPAFPIVGAGDSKKVGEVASPPEVLGDSDSVGEAEFFFLGFSDFFAPPLSAFPAGVGDLKKVGDVASPPEVLGDSDSVGEAEFFFLGFSDFFAPPLSAFAAGVGEAENVGEDAVSPPETLGDSATMGEAEFFTFFFFDFFAPSLSAFPAPAAGLVFLCGLSLCLSSSPFLGRSALANTPICICCTSSCARRVSSAVANGPPRRWMRVPIDEYFITRELEMCVRFIR
mmetsp:Transcript_23343/g.43020  ORF Transcript_23343/g.43020 Transcript_23343/m.43020 type:complete len:294 (-) Transcript_23343:29-910(-)